MIVFCLFFPPTLISGLMAPRLKPRGSLEPLSMARRPTIAVPGDRRRYNKHRGIDGIEVI